MKIAITARESSPGGEVDSHFGRAKGFIISDTESGEIEFVDNEQNVNARQGAGIQAARRIAALGVEWVLTGNCGPKAFRTLSAAGIKVAVGVGGTVCEAIDDFNAGKFKPADDANVEGHWT